ncbi:hypothetical protein HHI36_022122 [Cryptolaemus montrouzieri]|uniref:Uncharacterized protein n=1 Tax=Cryptolaemus montrouzieri TaxID=559131 RepID=A0ABD2MYS4_9CUCU
MSYEEQQRKLLALWYDLENDEDYVDSRDSDNENIVQESAHDSESVQEDDLGGIHSEDEQDDNQTTSSNSTSSENCFIGRDKKTMWSKICPNRAARTRSEYIRGEFSIVRPAARNRKTAEECFDIFSDEMWSTNYAELLTYHVTVANGH